MIRAYSLTLADGASWNIVGSEELFPWLGRLAAIMELKACEPDRHPKVIFTGRDLKSPSAAFKKDGSDSVVIRFDRNNRDAICEIRGEGGGALSFTKMQLSLYPIYKRALDGGGLPLHSALIEKDGYGVMLAASGNRGKSTCCRRLPQGWTVLCDDETLVVRDRDKRYFGHPFPTWTDYILRNSTGTVDVQKYVPVSGIFFLEQNETDEAVPIGRGRAATMINQSAKQVFQRNCRNMDKRDAAALKMKVFENACELAKDIPAFILKVSMKGSFWEEIEKVLKDARNPR